MTWLIKLYPPSWRRRYGRELSDLIATQPASFSTAVDLIAGAVDAWINPQSSTAAVAADTKGAGVMVSKMLKLKCSGDGPDVTVRDNLKAAAVILGGTLALVGIATLGIKVYGNNSYFESLLTMGWLVPFVASQHFTSLKGRPASVQAVLIGVPTAVLIVIGWSSAWMNS